MNSLTIQPRPGVAGKVAIITGASSGIGETAARTFAEAGALVVLVARREDRLSDLAEEIQAQGGVALDLPTDLTNPDEIANLLQTTLDRFGRVDILANIAGWGKYDWIEELDPQELRNQYEVNVLSLAEMIRQVVPVMKRQRSGYIINMSSYAGRIATPPLTIYASTKSAVDSLTEGLRRELAPWGIYVMRIEAGGVPDTEFNPKAAQRGGIRYRSLPIGRSTKEEVAETMLGLIENPRREVLMSRTYNLGAWINRNFPALMDFFTVRWVKRKRGQELKQVPDALSLQPARYSSLQSRILLMGAGMLLGAITVRALIHRARPVNRLVRRARKIEKKVSKSLAEGEK